jgi:DNA-binding response OmpR family regulator
MFKLSSWSTLFVAEILLVEHCSTTKQMVSLALEHEQHTVKHFYDGTEALEYTKKSSIDLAILDWMVPGLDGIEICKAYRSNRGSAPVLFLSGRSSVSDKICAFNSGADDYLTKPFEIDELLARARALLRRPGKRLFDLEIGSLRLNLESREAIFDGAAVVLSPKELLILELFMLNPRKIFSASEISTLVFRNVDLYATSAIRTHIKNLHSKLTTISDKELIKTVRSVGYRFASK